MKQEEFVKLNKDLLEVANWAKFTLDSLIKQLYIVTDDCERHACFHDPNKEYTHTSVIPEQVSDLEGYIDNLSQILGLKRS